MGARMYRLTIASIAAFLSGILLGGVLGYRLTLRGCTVAIDCLVNAAQASTPEMAKDRFQACADNAIAEIRRGN